MTMVLKRKKFEEDLFESSTEERDGSYYLASKKRRTSWYCDSENIPESIQKCYKGAKKIVPVKFIKCTFNELNSKKFMEAYEKIVSAETNSEMGNMLSSNSNDKNVSLLRNQTLTHNETCKKETAVKKKSLLNEVLFSNSYVSNPSTNRLSFQKPFHHDSTDLAVHDIYKQTLEKKNKPVKKSNPFTPQNSFNLKEKEMYKMFVNRFVEVGTFYQNIPAMKNFDEYTNRLEDWNLEKKVKEVLTIKPTSNTSDIAFYENDDPLVLDVMPSIWGYATGFGKPKVFSPEWIQEFGEDMIEKKRIYMARKERCLKQYQERRAKKWRNELQSLPELPLSSDVMKAFNLTKKLVLPELTPEMNAAIEEALLSRSQNAVVSKTSDYSILYKDIETLVGLNWLNDEIINTYLELIKKRSKQSDYPSVHVFSSFFYPKLKTSGYSAVKRWTRKDDIFSYDINLVPLHLGMHWCLAVIDHRCKKIQYYDSLNSKERCTPILYDYLSQEHLDKKKQPFDGNGWILENMENIPQQNNGSDCGMFTLKYAEYVTRNAKINFTQDHMPYFRRKMIYEVITGQIV